jgi:hypothetical protein
MITPQSKKVTKSADQQAPALDDPFPFAEHCSESKRAPGVHAPDVLEIAKRGGLPMIDGAMMYTLGAERYGKFPIAASGNHTAKFNSFLVIGLEKLAEDIRVFTSDDPRHRDPVAIRDTIRNTQWLTDEQIASICNGASAKELYGWLTDKCPRLKQWPPEDRFEGLKPRNKDFWDQMSSAGLTEPQKVAYSLKYEYNLRLNEIRRRMGVHHSTVQSHISRQQKTR